MATQTSAQHITETICTFLEEIGFRIHKQLITEETFLPGILISHGELIIDEGKLLYPGDILHEAGHLAVMTPEERINSKGNVGNTVNPQQAAGEEMMAICWSYAASCKLGLAPEVVFHPDGYKGSSDWLIEQYTSGNYMGLPILQWIGLCYDAKMAAANKAEAYPQMSKWLRN